MAKIEKEFVGSCVYQWVLLLVGLIWWQTEENIGDGGEEPNNWLSAKESHRLNRMQMHWTDRSDLEGKRRALSSYSVLSQVWARITCLRVSLIGRDYRRKRRYKQDSRSWEGNTVNCWAGLGVSSKHSRFKEKPIVLALRFSQHCFLVLEMEKQET